MCALINLWLYTKAAIKWTLISRKLFWGWDDHSILQGALIPLGVKAGMETRPKSLIEKSKRNFRYFSPVSRRKREM